MEVITMTALSYEKEKKRLACYEYNFETDTCIGPN
jgi:hypothetical protein